MKYGKLTITGKSVNKSKDGHYLITALCDCGKVWEGRKISLELGYTTSCGCFQTSERKRRAKVVFLSNVKHGASVKTSENFNIYNVWKNMKRRCESKTCQCYKYYGGRGISVCKSWQTFSNFLAWSIGKYKKGLAIDRINNNKGYSPYNCQFVEHKINMRNRSNTVTIKFSGIIKTQSEWAEYFKIPYWRIAAWRKQNTVIDNFKKLNL